MPGVFAADTPNERSHRNRLTEAHPVADVFQLRRFGLLAPGASARLETAHGGCRLAVRAAGILEIDGQPVRIVSHCALPLSVFQCPKCLGDKYRLHRISGVWACRLCHGLSYASRHRLRSKGARSYHRAIYLRRRIGAPLELFAPIEPKPLRCKRHWRLVREIKKLEDQLLAHADKDVSAVLERRYERHNRS